MPREAPGENSRETYLDDVLEVLTNPTRRVILYALKDSKSELTITELSHEVYQEFYNPGPQATQSAYTPQYNSIEEVTRALEHNHLPLLHRYGLLRYDEQKGIIEPKPLPKVTLELLDVLEDNETDQPLF